MRIPRTTSKNSPPVTATRENLAQQQSPAAAVAAAKSLQSYLTLCDPIDSSPPGSSVPGILQAEYWSGVSLPSPQQSPSAAPQKVSLIYII